MAFLDNGVLEPGFHDCTFSEFEATFVDAFPSSQSRKPIADSILAFSSELFKIGVPFEFWVDGSYATNKVNPNDADIVVFMHYSALITINVPYFQNKYSKTLDLYFACSTSKESEALLTPTDFQTVINNRNYWRGQFGFDRKDTPKGIIRLSCDSISEEIKRR